MRYTHSNFRMPRRRKVVKRGKASSERSRPRNLPVRATGVSLHLLPVLILIAALALRTVNITAFDTQFDERITKDVVTGIWKGDLSNNWKHNVSVPDYQTDQYNFSSYFYADALIAAVPRAFANPSSNGKDDLVIWSRLFSAVLGALAVYLLYLVALRLCGRRTALIAMVLMAVMPLLVQDSHYARPEAFVVALTASAYLFLLRFDSHPDRLPQLGCAAFCFGLLIACKISLAPMALLPFAFLLPLKNRRLLVWAAGICGICTLLGVFVGVPDAFFHPSAYWHGVEYLRHQYTEGRAPHALVDGSNSIALMAPYWWQTTGYLFCAFTLAGVFVLVRAGRFFLLAVVAGPVLFYLVFFSLQRTFFERNLSQIGPLMALLAAIALAALAEAIPEKARNAVLIALVALTAARPMWVSGRLVFLALPTSSEERARSYEDALLRTEQKGIDIVTSLLTERQVDNLVRSAQVARGDLLVRILDYHDSFTRKYLAELERRSNVREVGYFPSVFEDLDVSTLITYHGQSLRYIMLRPPPRAPGN
jgi:hypothetical protein